MFSVDPIPCMRFWALKKMNCSTARDVVHLCPPTKRKEKKVKKFSVSIIFTHIW
jgi:hypothetical protein